MKRPSELEKETIRRQIERKAVDLVNSYFHLRGEITVNNALSQRKISRVIQALTSGEEDLFTMEHEENHHGRDFFGIKQENESQIIKRIGIEEHESMEKIMLCQFAMRSLECNSSEDLEKKIDLRPVEREETPIVKVQEVDVKVEEVQNIEKSHIFHHSECRRSQEQPVFECRLAYLRLRSLPRVSYLEKSEDIENVSMDCIEKSADYQNQKDFKGEMFVKNEFSGQFPKNNPNNYIHRQSRKTIKKRSTRQKQPKDINCKYFLHTQVETKQKGRRPENPEMEVRLIPWIISSIKSGTRLTQSDIRAKARQITGKMKNQTKFSASKGWIEKFFRRNPEVQTLYSSHSKDKPKTELQKQKKKGKNFDLPEVYKKNDHKADENQIEGGNSPMRQDELIEQNF